MAIIKNLYIESGVVKGRDYVGGIAGESKGIWEAVITISNCYNKANVYGNNCVGGIVGVSYHISYCYNTGEINGKEKTGGVSSCNNGSIDRCNNEGKIIGVNYTGGITGFSTSVINSCYNTSEVYGEKIVGGVAGENTILIDNSYNIGSVNGQKFVGGLVGINAYYYDDDINTSIKEVQNYDKSKIVKTSLPPSIVQPYHGTIDKSYSIGTVTGIDSATTGAIAGVNLFEIYNTYFLDTLNLPAVGKNEVDAKDEAKSKKESEFNIASFDWDSLTWKDKSGLNGSVTSRPVLIQNEE